MNTQEFIKYINKQRLQGSWYFSEGIVENLKGNKVYVKLKGYKTWLQKLEIDSIKYDCPMDIKVSEWRNCLLNALGKDTK